MCLQEEQAAKLKAENIRLALEKIKEAQVKKVSHALSGSCGTCSPHFIFWVRSVLLHTESSGQ